MLFHAKGTFDVKNAPLSADHIHGTNISRFGLDKRYHGDLEAAAKGEMLGAGNLAAGTAGYVAIEQVAGVLHGRYGSFVLQHFGSIEGNELELRLAIVPGSGTGDLEGITGVATFRIGSNGRTYTFDYTLPAAAQNEGPHEEVLHSIAA